MKDAGAIGVDPQTANVRVEAFVPFKPLLPLYRQTQAFIQSTRVLYYCTSIIYG